MVKRCCHVPIKAVHYQKPKCISIKNMKSQLKRSAAQDAVIDTADIIKKSAQIAENAVSAVDVSQKNWYLRHPS
jgi:hypothetical protein